MSVFGVCRLLLASLTIGLAAAAAAQSTAVAPPPPPRSDTVGPEQLRDFALPGTRTPPPAGNDTNAPVTTAPARSAPSGGSAAAASPPRERSATRPAATGTAERPAPSTEATTAGTARPRSSGTAADPGAAIAPGFDPTITTAPTLPADPSPPLPVPTEPAAGGSTGRSSLLAAWPWLLLALGAAGAAWWWGQRRRSDQAEQGYDQLAFAGASGGVIDPPAPTPTPAPAPRPAPVPAPTPAGPNAPVRAPSVGLVSSRLRAWLDVDLTVRVAAITAEDFSLEVDILLTNSGSAAAREIAVEALLLNAGPEQERDTASFFGRPDAGAFASEIVAPMSQLALAATLRMPRANWQEYAVGGGKVVVPVVALNVGYKAGGSRGRSSAAFLVGRAVTEADKLGPFPTEGGAKGFNRIAVKRLPDQVRR